MSKTWRVFHFVKTVIISIPTVEWGFWSTNSAKKKIQLIIVEKNLTKLKINTKMHNHEKMCLFEWRRVIFSGICSQILLVFVILMEIFLSLEKLGDMHVADYHKIENTQVEFIRSVLTLLKKGCGLFAVLFWILWSTGKQVFFFA